jgi:mannose/cellobiose epimerase-like protein (N-acyl-D-glucosamine 2-epimerase family)
MRHHAHWMATLAAAIFLTAPSEAAWREESRATLERLLLENILPFWHPDSLEAEAGGYRMNHDIDGRWLGPSDRGIVSQARTVWFFSRLARSPYGNPDHLRAAEHGFHFLRDRLWDRQHGGFFWQVDWEGTTPTRPDKHLYGQAFGLYGLAEYYRASGNAEALELARRLFDLLDKHAYDREHGGYLESFRRDWSRPADDEINYMGVPSGLKLMNTHLHLLEAFSTYLRAVPDSRARDRLIELISIQSNAVVRKTVGACTDRHFRNWLPVTDPEQLIVSYGHDLENVWLLMDALESVRFSDSPFLDLFETLFDYSLRFGEDREAGGFFYFGPFNQPATGRHKDWWVQAEILPASLRMYRKTGEGRYLDLFHRTLRWVDEHQADWAAGEWFARVLPDGTRDGVKAGLWKSPYHNGRAMLECLEILELMTVPR